MMIPDHILHRANEPSAVGSTRLLLYNYIYKCVEIYLVVEVTAWDTDKIMAFQQLAHSLRARVFFWLVQDFRTPFFRRA